MNIETKLQALGLELPKLSAPAGAYVGNIIHGQFLYVAGQLPMMDGVLQYKGKIGEDADIDTGYQAARLSGLHILAQVNDAIKGDWGRFDKIIRLNGFVNCVSDFTDHANVINGASELMAQILGDAGKHTRIALGAGSLPRGALVEIDAIIGLKA